MNNNAIEYYKVIASETEAFCRSLNDYFGVSLFFYAKVFHEDSSHILLTNNIQVTEEYCSKIDGDVIYFENYLENNGRNKSVLWPHKPHNNGMQLFYNMGYWHGLSFIKTNEDNTEFCCFVADKNNSSIYNFYIKYYNILEKFSESFRSRFTDLIARSNQYKAKFQNGFDLKLPINKTQNHIDIQSFIQATDLDRGVLNLRGKFINLTPREIQCLALISKGMSLKVVGRELLLSSRTVEAHLNNIKNKTGYYSKSGLIYLYQKSFNKIDRE